MSRDIAIALIMAREVAKRTPQVIIKPAPKPATYIDRRANVRLPVILYDKSGAGDLKELVIKSASSSYRVMITVDGLEAYSNVWDWFYSNSQTIKEIAAFQEDGVYILSITDVKFSRSLRISFRTIKPVVASVRLTEVFMKVDEYG